MIRDFVVVVDTVIVVILLLLLVIAVVVIVFVSRLTPLLMYSISINQDQKSNETKNAVCV